jgi:hypothetical protein
MFCHFIAVVDAPEGNAIRSVRNKFAADRTNGRLTAPGVGNYKWEGMTPQMSENPSGRKKIGKMLSEIMGVIGAERRKC